MIGIVRCPLVMRRLRSWARSAAAVREPARAQALARHLAFRARWRATLRFGDLPLRQLRSLQRAYSRSPAPELLILGDFAMDWVPPGDDDYRHLPDMVRDVLRRSVSVESVVGPMYNARMVIAFLTAIVAARHKPSVIVLPVSTVTSQSLWLAHPVRGYAATAARLRSVAGHPARSPESATQPSADALAAWDDLPLDDNRTTAGRAQLIASSTPRTAPQREIWLRNLMSLYHGERLGVDSPGVVLAAELAALLDRLQVPTVAVVPPVHRENLEAAFGPTGVETVRRNADLLRTTFLDGTATTGQVVDLSLAFDGTHFVDPLHLNARGRYALAAAIAPVMAAHLA